MNIEKSALTLIEHVYDAALAPNKWQVMIEKLIAILDAKSGVLREANYTSGAVGLFTTHGYDPTLKQAYRDYFVHLDLFAPTLQHSAIGELIHGDAAVPWAQQRTSEFYNDYVRAQGVRYVLGATLARDAQHHLFFGLQRTPKQGDFNKTQMQLIQLVTPHITRAVQIHRQLAEVTTQKYWALSALNRLKNGIILLNDKGHPLFVNNSAECLMNRCGCVIADDGLLLTNVTDTLHLHRLIADAARFASGYKHRTTGGNLDLNTPTHSVRIQVIPLPRDLSDQHWLTDVSDVCVAVFISTMSKSYLLNESLMQRYRLTPAEARLAILLTEGMDLHAAARNLAVSIQTVRSQLKSVFSKTGVTRQAELVALLLSNLLVESPAE